MACAALNGTLYTKNAADTHILSDFNGIRTPGVII